jgi:site-specific DNA recombinase
MPTISTVAIYNRISRDNGENEDVLLNHREITTSLCKERGYSYKLFEEIESGGKYTERKQLIQMLKEMEDGLYDGLVVVELSRIARNNLYSQQVAEILVNNDVPIITPTRTYELNDESDRLMYDMEAMMSSKELRTITSRLQRGKKTRLRRGEWIQGLPPYGYSKNSSTKHLEIVPHEAEVVKLIFDLAKSGYGIPAIVKQLSAYKTRNGKAFTVSHVYSILKNKAVIGTLEYNIKNKKGKVIETIIADDCHPTIISPEQFNIVQIAVKGRISGNLKARTRSKGKCISVLKDLLFCDCCGRKLQLKRDSKQKEVVYIKACSCGNRGIAEARILDSFWEELSVVERYYRENWKSAFTAPTGISEGTLSRQLAELEERKIKLKTKLKRIRNSYHEGDITKAEWLEDKADAEKELETIEATISDVSHRLKQFDTDTLAKEYETKLNWLKDVRKLADRWEGKLFLTASDIFDTTTPTILKDEIEEINRMLKLVIHKVYYRRVFDEVDPDTGETEAIDEARLHISVAEDVSMRINS